MAATLEHLVMEEWKNTRKQAPPGGDSGGQAKRTERLVAEMRANLVKRKAAARGRDAAPAAPAKAKGDGV